MHRVWTVLTRDLAKAGLFIMGSHQALLLVMCWKMGSNAVICFMSPALLCSTKGLLTHTQCHINISLLAQRQIHKCIKVCIDSHRMDECMCICSSMK